MARPVPFTFPPETAEPLDWAPLAAISLSPTALADPARRRAEAAKLLDAASTLGFFYVVDAGFGEKEVMEQFGIGREYCDLEFDEKMRCPIDGPNANYYGFSPPGIQYTTAASGTAEPPRYEMFNLPKFTPEFETFHSSGPEIFRRYRRLIEPFALKTWSTGIEIMRLLALALEIPEERGGEDFFAREHAYGNRTGFAGDSYRYMMYHRTSSEQDEANNFTRIGGHTDAGSLTLLFSHPMCGLQIRLPGGAEEWRWVKHVPGAIIVNIADVLQFWTGGLLKSTVHRVVTPPKDQRMYERLGLLYFFRPRIDLDLSRICCWRESPPVRAHLLSLGRTQAQLEAEERAAERVEVGEWINARVRKIFTPVNNYTGATQEITKGIKLVEGGGIHLPIVGAAPGGKAKI
ncbi:hypothetical protein DFJ74DRAFT_713259 [Hyaloraphidium curvatum]|nr:hypothetical protein DFJ74DRAFT_713259 [Hyaloraphidium curvatum]